MPETTKTFANIEILQGADYEMTVTLDSVTDAKSYMVTISKDFTGATDFGGSTLGDGTSGSPYRTEVTEANQATIGRLLSDDTGTVYTVKLFVYAQWTELLDDDFDGFWEMVEKDSTSYSRIAQGEIYVSKSASRYASTSAASG